MHFFNLFYKKTCQKIQNFRKKFKNTNFTLDISTILFFKTFSKKRQTCLLSRTKKYNFFQIFSKWAFLGKETFLIRQKKVHFFYFFSGKILTKILKKNNFQKFVNFSFFFSFFRLRASIFISIFIVDKTYRPKNPSVWHMFRDELDPEIK